MEANVTENSTGYYSLTTISQENYSLFNNSCFNCTLANNSDDETIHLLENIQTYLWGILSPIIFVLGLIGNALNIIVLGKLRFWQKASHVFLFFLSLSDLTVLCVGLTKYWIQYVFDLNVRDLSNAGCKINLFVIYWSMQLSAWLLVCIVFERFLKTNFPLRYHNIVSVKKCYILLLCLTVILTGLDLHFMWTNGLKSEDNSSECTSLTEEYFYFEEYKFVFIDFAFVSVIPFVLMVFMNGFIYRVIRLSRKWRKNTMLSQRATSRKMKKFDMRFTRMLFFSSLYFLLSTSPTAIYLIVDSYVKPGALGEARKDTIWTAFYLFQFSNYTVNFFIYYLTNAKYKNTLKAMCGCRIKRFFHSSAFRRKVSTISSADSTMMSISESHIQDEFTSESRDQSESGEAYRI